MVFSSNSSTTITESNVIFTSSTSNRAAYGYLFLLFIPTLTILGNILVILAVLGDKQLKKSVTNRYIAALAFSDFLVGVIPMPLAVYVKVNGEHWNLGVGLCKFYVACDVTSSTASILHLLVISADRYLAISWPAEYQRYARKAKITFAIVLVWLISITLSIPVVMGKSILDTESCWLDNPEYMIYSSLLSFYIPAGVLTLVYVKIFRKIRVRQGIHSMLRASNGACGSERTPFHLPFVVVQEVSYDGPSSAEKKISGLITPSIATADVNQSATIFPSNTANNILDGRTYFQLIPNDDRSPTNSRVSKSKTFPVDFVDETESIFCLNEHDGLERKQIRGRSLVPFDFKRPLLNSRSPFVDLRESHIDRWKGEKSCHEDGIRLLSRTSSEKRPSDYSSYTCEDRAVQTKERRLSLWFHHSFQHLTENGNCFVIENDDEEHEDDEIHKPPATTIGNGKPKFFSRKNFDSSLLTLKEGHRRLLKKARRTSSLDEQRTPPDLTQYLKVDPPVVAHGVSASTSMDYMPTFFGPHRRISSIQVDEEEDDDDEETAVYALPHSVLPKSKAGFNLKKLATRVTNALHRITETQAVTKEKKATKLVALILGIFVISWLPFFTFNTMRGICLSAGSSTSDCDWLNSQFFFFTSWLGYANSSFNPIIYALGSAAFRAAFLRLLRCSRYKTSSSSRM